jgi:hypothetical protein
VEECRLERHSRPDGGAYQDVESVPFSGTLASTVLPELPLPPPNLLPGKTGK